MNLIGNCSNQYSKIDIPQSIHTVNSILTTSISLVFPPLILMNTNVTKNKLTKINRNKIEIKSINCMVI